MLLIKIKKRGFLALSMPSILDTIELSTPIIDFIRFFYNVEIDWELFLLIETVILDSWNCLVFALFDMLFC